MFQQDAVPEFGGKKIKLDLKRCDWFENSSSSVPVVNVKVKTCQEICVVVMLVKQILINFYLILRYLKFSDNPRNPTKLQATVLWSSV